MERYGLIGLLQKVLRRNNSEQKKPDDPILKTEPTVTSWEEWPADEGKLSVGDLWPHTTSMEEDLWNAIKKHPGITNVIETTMGTKILIQHDGTSYIAEQRDQAETTTTVVRLREGGLQDAIKVGETRIEYSREEEGRARSSVNSKWAFKQVTEFTQELLAA
jgi:hypothetical protein